MFDEAPEELEWLTVAVHLGGAAPPRVEVLLLDRARLVGVDDVSLSTSAALVTCSNQRTISTRRATQPTLPYGEPTWSRAVEGEESILVCVGRYLPRPALMVLPRRTAFPRRQQAMLVPPPLR